MVTQIQNFCTEEAVRETHTPAFFPPSTTLLEHLVLTRGYGENVLYASLGVKGSVKNI